jgi:hypothetical protein
LAFGRPTGFSGGSPPSGFTEMTGGSNSMGCDGSGNFFCFKANTLPPFTPALAANSTLSFNFDVTLTSGGSFAGFASDLKIAWTGDKSSIDGQGRFHSGYDLVSKPLPAVAVPAPLIGHGLPVLLAVGGILFGARLLERSNKRSPLGTATAIPDAAAT